MVIDTVVQAGAEIAALSGRESSKLFISVFISCIDR